MSEDQETASVLARGEYLIDRAQLATARPCSCGAKQVWIATRNGRRMPLSVATTRRVRCPTCSGERKPCITCLSSGWLYALTSHWADCTHAARYKRPPASPGTRHALGSPADPDKVDPMTTKDKATPAKVATPKVGDSVEVLYSENPNAILTRATATVLEVLSSGEGGQALLALVVNRPHKTRLTLFRVPHHEVTTVKTTPRPLPVWAWAAEFEDEAEPAAKSK